MRKLLVLDENQETRTELTYSLKALGYAVTTAEPGHPSDQVSPERFDLIVFHPSSIDAPALEPLGEIRTLPCYPPLVGILESEDPARAATLLECGCDGVVATGKNVLELKALIDSLLRRRDMYFRALEQRESIVRVGDLEIDVFARMVRTRTKSAELTDREMKLLLELARKPGVVCRRSDLLEAVWGSNSESLAGTLNTHINRLRMKIEDDFKNPRYLIGVYGVGYRLAIPWQARPAPEEREEADPALQRAKASR